jgi:predicted MFS family arabinose efflux permease
MPMTMLVNAIGWRLAMLLPGAVVLAALLIITALMRGTIKPASTGQTFAPLLQMLGNRQMWMLCLSAAVIFGIYYGISSQFGAKSLMDFCGAGKERSTFIIMIMTIVVAANNMGVNLLLKLCGNRRKMVATAGMLLCAAGCLLAAYAFRTTPSLQLVTAAYMMIAFPAGFFPLFGTIGKELCPPEHTALAVAMVNFWCFVDIAIFQNITGGVLQYFSIAGETVFPPYAYSNMFVVLLIIAIAGCIINFFYPETRPEK